MRKWGIIVTLVYAVIVVGLLLPAFLFLAGDEKLLSPAFAKDLQDFYTDWAVWLVLLAFVAAQAVLLFLSVDTSQKRLKPRAHILATCATTALTIAVLTFAGTVSILFVFPSNAAADWILKASFTGPARSLGTLAAFWLIWGVVFYRYLRNASVATTRAVSWMLKGSVLELLVAIPCHVIVRRRGECSAPIATGFGIASGIAIMLMSFGPGVLFLYRKRLDAYSKQGHAVRPQA